MWLCFRRYLSLLLFLTISFSSFSKNDTSAFNPVFRDSVLKNNIDSARWNKLVFNLDIHKKTNKHIFIQTQKQPQTSSVFLFISLAILIILLA